MRDSDCCIARFLTIRKHDGRVPCSCECRPPAQPGGIACLDPGVVEPSGYRLCDGAVVMRQRIRSDAEARERFRRRAIGDAAPERVRDFDRHERERTPVSDEVFRPERRAAKRREGLRERVFGGLREIPDRRLVVQVEPPDRLPWLKIGRRERLSFPARRIPWKAPPCDPFDRGRIS